METKFTIIHKLIAGKNILTISPEKEKGNNYKPKTIEVTEDQWNELKFHFATGVNDKTKETILAYVI
ncbi:MAG: hypothetical protein EOO20_14270 [Chryseobacterium sp.]|nr:MAG: hypothetical protein EOO20_14270 [Chryseobacterium sp.]